MNDQFDLIDPDERDRLLATAPRRGRPRAARTEALLAGSTIFIAGEDAASSRQGFISLARHYGKQARTWQVVRDGQPGLLVWWEDRDATAE